MVTIYEIPCSCGCQRIVKRKIYASGACKVKAFRDRNKQIFRVNEGTEVVTMKPKVTEDVKPLVTKDWQPTYNLSKEYFVRKKK